ncbi:MAG: hypothetical protein KJ040_05025 [Gammaproteobacteria bacterium]|nr:hypothetical protein [Gammaproteobacteria bacterium]
MTLAAGFLRGATSRLLPVSVPLRFFALAVLSQLGLWLTVFIYAEALTAFRGGLSPALGALHILTVGMLASTVIGASLQILPVATGKALPAVWPARLIFWLLLAGLGGFLGGVLGFRLLLFMAGGAALGLALLLFAMLIAANLWRPGAQRVAAAYAGAGLMALLATAALGVALALDFELGWIPSHARTALAHLVLGGYGFMGLTALGFSHVLVPMFALSKAPAARPAYLALAVALAGIVSGVAGALVDSTALLVAAAACGLVAVAVHLRLMRHSLQTGMRKRLGLSFVLVRGAWVALPLSLLTGGLVAVGWAGQRAGLLFGILLFGGWLQSFVTGTLQRILPMLVSMHMVAARKRKTWLEPHADRLLLVHAVAHGLALAALLIAALTGWSGAARAAGLVGSLGALAFVAFSADTAAGLLQNPPREG